jgi:hypothetical protein
MKSFIVISILLFLAGSAYGEVDGTPKPLGLEGKDGVIRQVPPYCGPMAHVENLPKLGTLCIQNDGKWIKSKGDVSKGHPCVEGSMETTRDGLVLGCQDNNANWKPAKKEDKPCLNSHGTNVWPDGTLVVCKLIDGKSVVVNAPASVTH